MELDTKESKIIGLIKAALKKADPTKNSNQNDCEAAMAWAYRQATLHDLNLNTIAADLNMAPKLKEFIAKKWNCGNKRLSVEHGFVIDIISGFYNVKTVRYTGRYTNGSDVEFVGTEENIEIAEYVYHYLCRIFRELWYSKKSKEGLKTIERQSYYAGLRDGLKDKLNIEKNNIQAELGIVLVKDPQLESFYQIHAQEKGLVMSQFKYYDRNKKVRNDGYSDASNISATSAVRGAERQFLLN